MSSTEDFSSRAEEAGKDKYCHEGGKLMAHPPPGEEIVISGMAGVFPNSNDICDLRENLFSKVDMVQANDRWRYDHPDLPVRFGAIPQVDRFDGGFFGVHERESHSLSAKARILQEKVLEAVLDAGLHPSELKGTRTGVYVGVIFSEKDQSWFLDDPKRQTFALMGSETSMIAHRISYFLKLKGPSTTLDNACSSSGYALENAYAALRSGEIDNAIVGGTHLCLHPGPAIQFVILGALNRSGCCKTFDNEADGYARAEGVVAVILQKAKNSKRIYSQIVHVKTNCDGFKEEGLTFPSKGSQTELLNDLYEECGVDRSSLSFVEAHGPGTKVGDVEECDSLDGFFCGGRRKPLPIGSIKSNIGHTEPTACLSSVVKCVLAMETDYIPPNIHFKTPNKAVAGLKEGRLKVVVDKTPLEDENALIGVNSFGIGGTNAHMLLKRISKRKVDSEDDLPRLVGVSGRTEEAVDVLLDQVEANATDVEYVKLLHEVFGKRIQNHLYRGFAVVSHVGAIKKSFAFCPKQDKPLYVVFGELENWREIGRQLVALPVFRDSILRIQEHLTDKGVSISDAFLNDGPFDGNRYSVLGAVAVQMAMVHLLELVDVKPEGCFGWSLGELASAYYNKYLTLEETVYCAFAANEAFLNDNKRHNVPCIKGSRSMWESWWENYGDILKDENLRKIEASRSDCRTVSADCLENALRKNRSLGMRDVEASSVILKIGEARLEETEDVPVISLFGDGDEGHLVEFSAGLGRLYLEGHDLQIGRLYPPVDFPVGRGTPMISPYVRWNHSREKFVPLYHLDVVRDWKRGIRHYAIDVADQRWAFVAGHVVDGKNLFPAAGYLYLVWETFSAMRGVPLSASRVSLRNCMFVRATGVPPKGGVVFTVSIMSGTGDFEVAEGDSTVATGTVGVLPDSEVNVRSLRSLDLWESQGPWMDEKDVYKELRLRGYQYSGEFRAIEKFNPVSSAAYLKWTENWIAFLDNVLQLTIFRMDDRALQVPTFISRADIATDIHLDLIEEAFGGSADASRNLLVRIDSTTEKITCGGVTVSGMITSPIVRKKNPERPLLQSSEFVPNFAQLALHTSVRVNVQIILENTMARKFKAVEVVDEFSDGDVEPLTPVIKSYLLHEERLGQPAVTILSERALDVDVNVESDEKLENETGCLLVIVSKIVDRPEVLKSALAALKENGFVISRESPHCEVRSDSYPEMTIVTAHRTPSETILLLRRQSPQKERRYIEINSSKDFTWLPEVQDALNGNPQTDLVLYSVDPTGGILGMMTCLKKEYTNENVRCVFLMDEGEVFDPTSKKCGDQLEKNMVFNVHKNDRWGTFRCLPLEDSRTVESEHCFVNTTPRCDLSSLAWVEGALTHRETPELREPDTELVYVYYSAINFKDVMVATGKIGADLDYLDGELTLGVEFCGRDARGRRVMGSCFRGAHGNLLLADRHLTYAVPDRWTMEEAATVPFTYSTAMHALITCGRMRRGESVLIHSGAGGVGQAAINLALHYGCEVFTTVGTREKREFLKRTYPQLRDENIGNSHDESFEQMVLGATDGRGVDMVLNSLAGEKLVASARCLAFEGRFLEIGKADLRGNVHLSLTLLDKRASYHGVMLDKVFGDSNMFETREVFLRLMGEGALKPLNRSVFGREEAEQAFRFMASGRHTGKVLIQMREAEEQLVVVPPTQTLRGLARYYCDPRMVYVIVGGLGGFGMELADWLVRRGARKLVLTSRKGMSNGYQRYRIRLWESYGVIVGISTAPVATRDGCERLMEEASRLGGVVAVFNLAIVLDDAVFENQTPESFRNAFEPKAIATKHLDYVTRAKCRDLRDFVVFSSAVATIGNAGQTNYGMANSVMERICERRRRDGYPALAIQWGLVGEVGIAAEVLDTAIEGLASQPISSCLQVLDALLTQREAVVVSSMVLARKEESQSSENVVDKILNIIGVTDSRYVSVHSTLAELGMDSMLAIEIKIALERDFGIFLSTKEMRTATLARLKEIQEGKTEARGEAGTRDESNFGSDGIFRLSEEDLGDKPSRVMPELDEKSTPPKAVLFPGIEGFAQILNPLSKRLADVTTVQYVPDGQSTSVATIVESLFPTVQKLLPESKTFFFVAYSYGALIALEMVHILEGRGYSGTLICVDGAPIFSKGLANTLNAESEQRMLTSLVCQLLSFFVPPDEIIRNKVDMSKCETWQENISFAGALAKTYDANKAYYVEKVAEAIYLRQQDSITYQPTYGDLKSEVKLFRPTVSVMQDIEDDYGLSRFFRKPVEIRYFEGDHETILNDEKLADVINLSIQKLA